MNDTKTMVEYRLVNEFKKALKERISNSDLSFMYQKLFFNCFISEKELNDILKYYQGIFKTEPENWFAQFHKSIRQTDFFDGTYFKEVNILTDEEMERRRYLIPKKGRSESEVEELRQLNKKYRHLESVEIAGIVDAMLYSLIHLDEENKLKDVMEIAFKICS